MRKDSRPAWIWFLTGFGLGAVIGVLAAPQPGADIRRMIGETADLGRDLYEKGRQLADDAAALFEEGRKLMDNADDMAEASA